jgi:hypothetical protein
VQLLATSASPEAKCLIPIPVPVQYACHGDNAICRPELGWAQTLGYVQTAPTHIYEVNIACVAMSENPARRKFSRHIDIRRYFVRDMVAAGVNKLVPLRTHLMVADALTKSLSSPAHIKHREIRLGHVPFSFAARTLRRFVGGGGGVMISLSFSLYLS